MTERYISTILDQGALEDHFGAGVDVDSLTNEQIGDYIRERLTDDVIREELIAQAEPLIQEQLDIAREEGFPEEHMAKLEEALRDDVVSPENIQTSREAFAMMENMHSAIRDSLAEGELSEEQLAELREEATQTSRGLVGTALSTVIENNIIEAAFWGGDAAAAARMAQKLSKAPGLTEAASLGKRIPVVGLAVAVVFDGGSAIYNFTQGEYEEGTVDLGGLAGGVGGTILAAKLAVASTPLIVPAAIGVASYYAARNTVRAGYIIAETHAIWSDIDSQFQPDHDRHSNLIGSMSRVLGDGRMNARLAAAGVPTDPETGRVTMRALSDALIDPETGDQTSRLLRSMITEKRDDFKQVQEDNTRWYDSRYMVWSDSQSDRLHRRESARMDARIMSSGLAELSGYRQQLAARHAEQQAAAQAAAAELQAELQNYRDLPDDMQALIDSIAESQYEDYANGQREAGNEPLPLEDYMNAQRITISQTPETLAALQPILDNVNFVVDQEIALWQDENPEAGQDQIATQRQALFDGALNQVMNDSSAFEARYNGFASQDPEQPDLRVAQTDEPADEADNPALRLTQTDNPAYETDGPARPTSDNPTADQPSGAEVVAARSGFQWEGLNALQRVAAVFTIVATALFRPGDLTNQFSQFARGADQQVTAVATHDQNDPQDPSNTGPRIT